ncbi:hypothetical protein CFK37_17075 [Virgibacillus phasianinus]|uniref:Uncharacterized protein n=1 Tax=Virgibacillus phasianinus TaxID=2017483 RepID=A0A220U6S0_9BACI|nr:hypothetical protein [Virgibacillus phasianinus]ASK63745.1 hypothetical protein CFK37_17075 [Virgibacillus phasianinus]
MGRVKSVKFWGIVAGMVILVALAFSIGSDSAKATVEGEKLKYDEIISKIERAKADLKTNEEELKKSEAAFKKQEEILENKRTEVDEAIALVQTRDQLNNKVEDLKTEVSGLKTDQDKIKADIKLKQKELDEVTNAVKKKKEDPVELMAGQYVVGKDVPGGRYQVTNVGRGTNFFVYDSRGYPTVNTILGNDSIGSGDYVFFTTEGDTIETLGKVKLIPVE